MIEIQEYHSLQTYNTFGIDVKARYFVSVHDLDSLKEVLNMNLHPKVFLLGGGSNMLLTQDLDMLVIHLDLKGIRVMDQDDDRVTIEVMAGENWHELVCYCLEQDWGGIENLSLIPGNVGTAPIQNIGAYGVELQDVFVGCHALERSSLETVYFDKEACQFGYRDSVFKGSEKGRYIITSVQLQLSKRNHQIQTGYGAIKSQLETDQVTHPSIQDVSKAVIAIRRSKLPDPAVLGNSGSFFKNPVIDADSFQQFHNAHPEAPYYDNGDGRSKVPAGWLIEHAGLKGYRLGDAGVHERQALVLVNHGNASGQEIWSLAMHVQKTVLETFGIVLEPEVNVI